MRGRDISDQLGTEGAGEEAAKNAQGEEELEKGSLHEERWTSKKNDSSIIINMKS